MIYVALVACMHKGKGGNSRGADCATVAKIVNLEKVAEKEKLESVKNESVLTVFVLLS